MPPGMAGHLPTPFSRLFFHRWRFDGDFTARSLAADPARHRLLLRLWQRGSIIMLIGLTINPVPTFELATLRWPGVLQRIGLCIVIAAPMVLWSSAGPAGLTLVLLTAYSGLMLGVAVPGADGVVSTARSTQDVTRGIY